MVYTDQVAADTSGYSRRLAEAHPVDTVAVVGKLYKNILSYNLEHHRIRVDIVVCKQ